MQISVVIPVYNEEAVVASTLRDVLGYLKKKFSDWEVIVVNDGSRDATEVEVKKFPQIRYISYDRNRGKGYAVKTGMLASAGDLVLFMDADNSTNIRELNHFLSEIADNDIVIGSRALSTSRVEVSQNIIKRTLGRMGNGIIRLALGLSINDTQCGFKLFRKRTLDIFKQQHISRWGFDFEILFLAKIKGYRIKESPVVWINNFDSKVTPGTYVKTFTELAGVRWRYYRGKYR